ncbi:MAG: hypothetical protein KF761_12425 [Salinibacterium sp.]|nr:hypothetical protein [Salinibacterium sp.]
MLALFLGSGIAVAAVSSVQAHTPAINSDCASVWVDAWDYNPALVNTVQVTIFGGNPDGSDRVENRTFGAEFHEKFFFPDSSLAWSYTATIDAPDGTNGTQFDYSWSDTTAGCATPDIGVTASQCINTGDLTSVTATISPLDASHAYTVQLTGTNGYDSGVAAVLTTSAVWNDLEPGYDYTAELIDTTSGLSDSDTVHAIGCPQPPEFDVTITQCTTVGGSGVFDVTVSSLVTGRNYILALHDEAGGAPVEVPFTATGATFSYSFTTAPSGSYHVAIGDVADGSWKMSNTAHYLPCPGTPNPVLDPTQCTTADGTSNASMVSSVDLLIPGRSYTIAITTGATTVYSESLAPAASSSWTKTLFNLAPGDYVLTVTDTTDPASAGFTASTSTTIKECPSQQDVSLEAVQCEVPGGSGTLTATVTNFTIGRSYTVTLTQNGLPVTGQPASENFDPTTAAPAVFTYAGLAPGLTYRVLVEDVTPPAVAGGGTLPIAANDILLADCPGNPDVFLTQPTCTVFTTSTITVGVGKLIPGETYTVAVTTTKDGKPVSGVADQQIVATVPTASLQFTDLPVGSSYTITVTNLTKTLSATGDIMLTLCDLPTLAYTGASTMTPTLAGLGFLQFGLVLVGISLVRRRSGAREV